MEGKRKEIGVHSLGVERMWGIMGGVRVASKKRRISSATSCMPREGEGHDAIAGSSFRERGRSRK